MNRILVGESFLSNVNTASCDATRLGISGMRLIRASQLKSEKLHCKYTNYLIT